jgi:hypothetical protein
MLMSQSEIKKGLELVDSRMIALIASKRKFDPAKEAKYIERARTTKCRCKHWTQTNPCFYHTCRHRAENHYGLPTFEPVGEFNDESTPYS